MRFWAQALVALVALLHFWFLTLEMFLWRTPLALKIFHTTAAQAESTAVLAANQGLYNGFLAAGLAWSLFLGAAQGQVLQRYLLACVVVAGIYGAWTVSPRIFLVQGLPAAAALALTFLS
jgi:putative membrane protein